MNDTRACTAHDATELGAPEDDARSPWTHSDARRIYDGPFNDLLFQAHTVHRAHFDPNVVQLSQQLSIKTGGCPEDCGYCSQSAHHSSGLKASKLMAVDEVIARFRDAFKTLFTGNRGSLSKPVSTPQAVDGR